MELHGRCLRANRVETNEWPRTCTDTHTHRRAGITPQSSTPQTGLAALHHRTSGMRDAALAASTRGRTKLVHRPYMPRWRGNDYLK